MMSKRLIAMFDRHYAIKRKKEQLEKQLKVSRSTIVDRLVAEGIDIETDKEAYKRMLKL